jgi:hypothetical protein
MAFPYGKLMSESVKQAFSYRRLWIFSLFVAEAGMFFNVSDDDFEVLQQLNATVTGDQTIGAFLASSPGFIGYMFFLFVLIVGLSLLSVVAKGSLIRGIAAIRDKKPLAFSSSLKNGTESFWRVLWVDVLLWLPNIVFVGLLIWVYFSQVAVVGLVVGVAMLLYNLFVALFRHYTYCDAVLGQQSSWAAIKSGMQLFFNKPKETIVVNLMKLGVVIVAVLATVIIGALVAMPFFLLMFLFSLVLPWQVALTVVGLGLVATIIAAFGVKAIQTQTLYGLLTKTYWELRKGNSNQ